MNTQNMTTEQKLALLMNDFLERDGDTFVKVKRTGRLGWENTIPEAGAYSDYMLHPESQEDLIKNAYRMATDMITVMDAPFKVQIRITNDNSATDSGTVWVATKVFDDVDLSNGKKLDTFIGLAVHEGCHLLYTKFDVLSRAQNKIVANLQNIIEDERIERECGDAKPGLVNFLAASKYYYFDKYKAQLDAEGRMSSLGTFERLLNSILSLVRYPKSLNPDDMREFVEPLLKVREILTPYPTSTEQSLEAAQRIYDVIKNYLESKSEKQQSQTGESKSEGKKGKSGNAGPSSNAEEQMQKGMDRMQDALENICKEPSGDKQISEAEQSETIKQDGGRIGKVCEGRMDIGTQKKTFIERGTDNKDVYNESLDRVRCYIPAIAKALRCSSTEYKFSLHGMRSGLLDTGKLAEAFQGVPTVYIREGQVKSDKVAVCILIDESGSMWGPGEMAARDTAVLLNEAIGKLPNVDLYIYGHTASRQTTDLFVYRERGYNKRYSLGSTESRAGNHDSIAIREAAARVRQYTKERVLFFVVSDGAPNESTELVRSAVLDVEKQGFNVVAISIDPYYDPSTMYSHNVTFSDMSRLAIDLGKMVKQSILKNTNKSISK